jgi:hypothetical protein
MRRLLIVLMVLVALSLPAAAQAHYGNKWFSASSRMERDIMRKYDVAQARCVVVPPSERVRYNAHSTQDSFGAKWDHYVCAIYSNVTERACLTIGHNTGPKSADLVLTSYRVKGCGSRDIGRR